MKRTTRTVFQRLLSRPESGALEAKKRIWRISDRAPLGEWVDPNVAPVAPPAPPVDPEEPPSGWLTSSMDLLGGAEVVEYPHDSAPGELTDEPGSTPADKRHGK